MWPKLVAHFTCTFWASAFHADPSRIKTRGPCRLRARVTDMLDFVSTSLSQNLMLRFAIVSLRTPLVISNSTHNLSSRSDAAPLHAEVSSRSASTTSHLVCSGVEPRLPSLQRDRLHARSTDTRQSSLRLSVAWTKEIGLAHG